MDVKRSETERRASPPITPKRQPGSAPWAVVPVVGIGASAGGFEVFKLLLAELPVDTGLAIVFIQHLDPKHHSMLAEILAQATTMPVSEAADGMPVEPNHVYVIPANVDLTIAHGTLRYWPPVRKRRDRTCPSTGSCGPWPTSAEAGPSG